MFVFIMLNYIACQYITGRLTTPVYIEHNSEKVFEAISEFANMSSFYHNLHLSDVHLVNMNQNITEIMIDVFTKKKKSQLKHRKGLQTERPIHQES